MVDVIWIIDSTSCLICDSKMKINSGNRGCLLCFPIPEAGLAQKEMDEINEAKMETCPTNWHDCKMVQSKNKPHIQQSESTEPRGTFVPWLFVCFLLGNLSGWFQISPYLKVGFPISFPLRFFKSSGDSRWSSSITQRVQWTAIPAGSAQP